MREHSGRFALFLDDRFDLRFGGEGVIPVRDQPIRNSLGTLEETYEELFSIFLGDRCFTDLFVLERLAVRVNGQSLPLRH